MKIAICDDNKETRQILKTNIDEFFNANNNVQYSLNAFSSGDDLLDSHEEFDLLFLDIEMPGQDGITVGKKIKDRLPKIIIIIVTSFSEYLDDAMRFSVFRYLSKPIEKKRFFRNMTDALDAYMRRSKEIGFDTADGYQKIETDKIIMIEAINRKVTMYTEDGIYDITGSINDWVEKIQLPNFYICHRGYLINISKIYKIGTDKVFLCNGKYQAYLTKRKYTELKNLFMLYIERNR